MIFFTKIDHLLLLQHKSRIENSKIIHNKKSHITDEPTHLILYENYIDHWQYVINFYEFTTYLRILLSHKKIIFLP